MSWNVSVEYAKKLARRWRDGDITSTAHYARMAKYCLKIFPGFFTQEEHSLLVGLIEHFQHYKK